MSFGDFLEKALMAPVKLAILPVKAIGDVIEDCSDRPIKTLGDSIESQIKDIVD